MFGEQHDLHHEFPDMHDKIHDLKVSDTRFQKLFDDYENVNKEIHRIETGIETPEDMYTEELKKKRLALKDDLYAMLTA